MLQPLLYTGLQLDSKYYCPFIVNQYESWLENLLDRVKKRVISMIMIR